MKSPPNFYQAPALRIGSVIIVEIGRYACAITMKKPRNSRHLGEKNLAAKHLVVLSHVRVLPRTHDPSAVLKFRPTRAARITRIAGQRILLGIKTARCFQLQPPENGTEWLAAVSARVFRKVCVSSIATRFCRPSGMMSAKHWSSRPQFRHRINY